MNRIIAIVFSLLVFTQACSLEEALLPKIDQTTVPGKPFSFTCFYTDMILFKGYVMLNEGTVDTWGDQLTTGALECSQLGFKDFFCVIDKVQEHDFPQDAVADATEEG